MTALALDTAVVQLASVGLGRRWGRRVAAGWSLVAAAAVVAAVVADGELWTTPLTELLYGLDLAFLVAVPLAHLVSIALRTPGSELSVVVELTRRVRGAPNPEDTDPMWCAAGLHQIDQWEARQPRRTNP